MAEESIQGALLQQEQEKETKARQQADLRATTTSDFMVDMRIKRFTQPVYFNWMNRLTGGRATTVARIIASTVGVLLVGVFWYILTSWLTGRVSSSRSILPTLLMIAILVFISYNVVQPVGRRTVLSYSLSVIKGLFVKGGAHRYPFNIIKSSIKDGVAKTRNGQVIYFFQVEGIFSRIMLNSDLNRAKRILGLQRNSLNDVLTMNFFQSDKVNFQPQKEYIRSISESDTSSNYQKKLAKIYNLHYATELKEETIKRTIACFKLRSIESQKELEEVLTNLTQQGVITRLEILPKNEIKEFLDKL
ncbi:MAG: hypothetical protein ACLUZV_00425 [Streptococcus salivarius]